MLRKLAEKDKSKKGKYDDIDKNTKEVDINENGDVAETDNDEIFVDAANDTPPPQDAMTNTTDAVTTEEGGDDDNVGAEDGDDDDEAYDTKGGGGGEDDPEVEYGNDD